LTTAAKLAHNKFMDIKNLKHHPSEDTEQFKKVIQEVTKEAENSLKEHGVIMGQRGSGSQLNQKIRIILREKYNIDWLDPYTYNGIIVD
jgi:hypothetical protein